MQKHKYYKLVNMISDTEVYKTVCKYGQCVFRGERGGTQIVTEHTGVIRAACLVGFPLQGAATQK